MIVVFVATLVRSAFGFGEALVAVPLLALMIPVSVATPLMALVSVTVAAMVVFQDWDKVHLRSVRPLVGFTFLGIPLGVLLLRAEADRYVKECLPSSSSRFPSIGSGAGAASRSPTIVWPGSSASARGSWGEPTA